MADQAQPSGFLPAVEPSRVRRRVASPVMVDTAAAQRLYSRRAGWTLQRSARAVGLSARYLSADADAPAGGLLLARLPIARGTVVDAADADYAAAAARAAQTNRDGRGSGPLPGVAADAVPAALALRLQRRADKPGLIGIRMPAILARAVSGKLQETRLEARLMARGSGTQDPTVPGIASSNPFLHPAADPFSDSAAAPPGNDYPADATIIRRLTDDFGAAPPAFAAVPVSAADLPGGFQTGSHQDGGPLGPALQAGLDAAPLPAVAEPIAGLSPDASRVLASASEAKPATLGSVPAKEGGLSPEAGMQRRAAEIDPARPASDESRQVLPATGALPGAAPAVEPNRHDIAPVSVPAGAHLPLARVTGEVIARRVVEGSADSTVATAVSGTSPAGVLTHRPQESDGQPGPGGPAPGPHAVGSAGPMPGRVGDGLRRSRAEGRQPTSLQPPAFTLRDEPSSGPRIGPTIAGLWSRSSGHPGQGPTPLQGGTSRPSGQTGRPALASARPAAALLARIAIAGATPDQPSGTAAGRADWVIRRTGLAEPAGVPPTAGGAGAATVATFPHSAAVADYGGRDLSDVDFQTAPVREITAVTVASEPRSAMRATGFVLARGPEAGRVQGSAPFIPPLGPVVGVEDDPEPAANTTEVAMVRTRELAAGSLPVAPAMLWRSTGDAGSAAGFGPSPGILPAEVMRSPALARTDESPPSPAAVAVPGTMPAAGAPPAMASAGPALPELAQLAEQVARILVRRFEIERERRGGKT